MSHVEGTYRCSARRVGFGGVLRALRIDARHAIYVGDPIPGGEAARAAGMDLGAVTWGCAPHQSLDTCMPTLRF